jgi:hypothetical protein
VWVPRRRRQAPGSVVPRLEEVRAEVEQELRENKVESDTDEFLEEARAAAEIVILEQGTGNGGQSGPAKAVLRPSPVSGMAPASRPAPGP